MKKNTLLREECLWLIFPPETAHWYKRTSGKLGLIQEIHLDWWHIFSFNIASLVNTSSEFENVKRRRHCTEELLGKNFSNKVKKIIFSCFTHYFPKHSSNERNLFFIIKIQTVSSITNSLVLTQIPAVRLNPYEMMSWKMSHTFDPS